MKTNEKITKSEQQFWNSVEAYHEAKQKKPRLRSYYVGGQRFSYRNVWICEQCGAEFDEDPTGWCGSCVIGIPRGWMSYE